MNDASNFQKKSYAAHEKMFESNTFEYWLNEDTVDYWRHKRMYQSLDPLLENETESSWLTVGDGRYGRDANYILKKGHACLATDICDDLLIKAKEKNYILTYQKENAEFLSFQDNEFDYTFCKESYHHFPRPTIALYEMLRVSKKGIVLIEPNDAYINCSFFKKIFRKLKLLIKSIVRKEKYNDSGHQFEPIGNYIFTISQRELEKISLGIDIRLIAIKGLNDAYIKGVEKEKISDFGNLQKKIRTLIGIGDLLCKLGVMDYGLLSVIIFKNTPSIEIMNSLKKNGFQLTFLPKNPYAKF